MLLPNCVLSVILDIYFGTLIRSQLSFCPAPSGRGSTLSYRFLEKLCPITCFELILTMSNHLFLCSFKMHS